MVGLIILPGTVMADLASKQSSSRLLKGSLDFPSSLFNTAIKIKAIPPRWKNNRDKLIDTGNDLVEVLKTVSSQTSESSGSQTISEDIVHSCFHQLRLSYDKINGGFSTSPKFPSPPTLYFLMRYHALQKTSPLKDKSISIAELKAKAAAEG